MNFRIRALIAIGSLFCVVAFIWYLRAWIHGGQFGYYLFYNALFLSVSSGLMFLLFVSRWRIKKGAAMRFKGFLGFWLILGFASAFLIFASEQLNQFLIGEPLLFTAWPSYAMLMVPDAGVVFGLIFLLLSFTTNAVLYSAWSSLVWWFMSRTPQFTDDPPPAGSPSVLRLH
jgi:hypothetical protein